MHIPPKLIILSEIASDILEGEDLNDAEKDETEPDNNGKDVDK